MINTITCGDCLELMKNIPDKSIDMILQDPPYYSTACKWDWDIMTKIDELWYEWKRIIKPNGVIVITASQPFTSKLVISNLEMFKYVWIWKKSRKTGFQMARKRPMKAHEDIIIFYNKQPTYNQNLIKLEKPISSYRKNGKGGNLLNEVKTNKNRMQEYTGFNTDIIEINNEHNVGKHPTQKPVALFEFLIKTYTNDEDIVFDGFAGSFTTAIASENLKRNWICIEIDKKYCEIGQKRVDENRIILNLNLL